MAAEASLTPGARQLLENTATELLAAAEEAASRRDRGAAARQFQRAALHLEIVRLLGGKPLAPALEASRRYARWRARRLSHLLENCVLEHSPEDPRTFDAAYSLTGEILGRGGYGVVLGCTRRADQEAFACKRLDLKRLSAKGLARLHEEIAALKALDHPHIVRLREVFYSDTGRTCLVSDGFVPRRRAVQSSRQARATGRAAALHGIEVRGAPEADARGGQLHA